MATAADNPATEKVPSIVPLMIIFLGGAMTGFSAIFVRLSETGPIATGAWRLAIATLALAPLLRLAGAGAERRRFRFSPIIILAGVFFAADMSFYNWSLDLTSIAHATLIVNMAPVVALAAGFLLFGEHFGPAKAAGLVASLSGAALMTLMGAQGDGTVSGNALALLAMIGYALYLVAVKHARTAGDTVSIMIGSSATASVIMFVTAMLLGETILPGTVAGWAVLVALGLVSHAMGQGLVAFGMREVPVGLASIFLLAQPIVAALAAWAVFGETMGPVEAVGAVLVLAGLVISSRSRR